MIRRRLFVLGTVALLGVAASRSAFADVRREVTERRPYIVEVGAPYSVSRLALEREAEKIHELREYLADYGYPDYSEVQEIEPQWPWESYEIRTFYMQRNLEVDFGHVFLSPAMPQFGVVKFLGDIPPDKRHEIEVILQAHEAPPVAPVPPAPPPAPMAEAPVPAPPQAAPAAEPPPSGGLTEALVARIEAAAERAAQAADQAAEQSEAAVRAADRTTNIVNKMIDGSSSTENGRQ